MLKIKNVTGIFVVASTCAFTIELLRLMLPVYIYDINQSASDVATFRSVWVMPNIILAVFIGVINDRIRKISSIRVFVLLQLLSIFIITLVLFQSFQDIRIILIVTFLLMTANYAFMNAQSGFIQKAVAKEKILQVNSLLRSVVSVITVVGPLISGVLLTMNQPVLTLMLCCGLLFVASLMTTRMTLAEEVKKEPFFRSLVDGLSYFWTKKPLLLMTGGIMVANGTGGVYSALLVPHVMRNFGDNGFLLGLIYSSAGIGGLVGSMIAPRIREKLGTWLSFASPIALTGVVYMGLSLSVSAWSVAGLSFLEGVSSTVMVLMVWSYRQESTSRLYISRVVGITGSLFKLCMPIFLIVGGFYGESASIEDVFVTLGVVNMMACVSILLLSRQFCRVFDEVAP